LADLLADTASMDAATKPTMLPSLWAIPAGLPSSSLAQLFDEDRFGKILERARAQYDLVLVDSAPMVPVVEPIMIAHRVDGILLIALAGRTPLNLARRMKQIVAPFRDRVVGVVLNNATRGLPYYYEHSYYGYHTPTRRRPAKKGEKPNHAPPGGDAPGGNS
jgi:Mrp family chromosome partitioning ATPase